MVILLSIFYKYTLIPVVFIELFKLFYKMTQLLDKILKLV